MAAGDVVTLAPTSVAAGAYLAIQPGVGIEWVLHNIYYSGQVTISKYDGVNDVTVDSDTSVGARLNLQLHASNAVYYRVHNTGSGSIFVSYDGVQTNFPGGAGGPFDLLGAAAAAQSTAEAYSVQRANHTGTQLAATISDFNAAVQTNRLDQMAAPTADISLATHKLTNVVDPAAAQDAATKHYVDNDARFYSIAATQQSGNYTFALADAGTVVEGTSATAQTFTVPPSSSVAWVAGTVIEVFEYGAGQVTIAAGVGVTLRSDGAKVKTAGQYGTIRLRYRGSNEWTLAGDLA